MSLSLRIPEPGVPEPTCYDNPKPKPDRIEMKFVWEHYNHRRVMCSNFGAIRTNLNFFIIFTNKSSHFHALIAPGGDESEVN